MTFLFSGKIIAILQLCQNLILFFACESTFYTMEPYFQSFFIFLCVSFDKAPNRNLIIYYLIKSFRQMPIQNNENKTQFVGQILFCFCFLLRTIAETYAHLWQCTFISNVEHYFIIFISDVSMFKCSDVGWFSYSIKFSYELNLIYNLIILIHINMS